MKKVSALLLIWASFMALPSCLKAEAQHGMAMHGDLKYPPTFTHFDTVNPNAPKGGELKLAIVGTFDSLNPYILKGTAAPQLRDLTFETLLSRSPNEPLSFYGLVAESVEVAPDRSWVVFNINPKAKWQDGKPITAKDVAFSYQTFLEHGTPGQKIYYKKVEKIDVLDERKVKFTFKKVDGKYDAEMPIIMSNMPSFGRA